MRTNNGDSLYIYVAHINMFSGSEQLILALLHVQ